MLSGIPVSGGIGLAKAVIIKDTEIIIDETQIDAHQIDDEVKRLEDAIASAVAQLHALYERAAETLGDEAKIMEAQVDMLNDPMVNAQVKEKIEKKRYRAELAVERGYEQSIAMLRSLDDPYLRERAADLEDVKMRLLKTLLGIRDVLDIREESIVIGANIAPSQMVGFNAGVVKGIICETGGATAHTAILARNMDIPAVMGCADATKTFQSGQTVCVNGSTGQVSLVDNPADKKAVRREIEALQQIKKQLEALREAPAITRCGVAVGLTANIGSPVEASLVDQYGGDGVGLFRTEFLYMESNSLPGEEQQFNVYKRTIQALPNKMVTFRTMDIGGDKELPYFEIPKEENPFLGWRAIRLCLDTPKVFRTQLRALYRASAYAPIKIMIPMVSSLDQMRKVRQFAQTVQEELNAEGFKLDPNTQLGTMVEIPSAALCADLLAKEADFFSIGTNDLVQYTLAVDRGNKQVSQYYDFFEPAVLRLVRTTINASHQAGKTVSMCGEAAGDPIATILLLGLGLDSFSMSPSSIPKIKKLLSAVTVEEARQVADRIMEMEESGAIRQLLLEQLKEHQLEHLLRI